MKLKKNELPLESLEKMLQKTADARQKSFIFTFNSFACLWCAREIALDSNNPAKLKAFNLE